VHGTLEQMLRESMMAEGSNEVCKGEVSPLCQCLE
jgi:hypothetical protein